MEYAIKNKFIDPVAFTKETFKPLNLFFQIDDYIASKRKQVSLKMINVYRNMKDTLKAFEAFRGKPITFESFDFNFYEKFGGRMSTDL